MAVAAINMEFKILRVVRKADSRSGTSGQQIGLFRELVYRILWEAAQKGKRV